MVRMPSAAPAWMAASIWWDLASRMRVRMAVLDYITSKATVWPPSTVGTSCWLMTACSTMLSWMRT